MTVLCPKRIPGPHTFSLFLSYSFSKQRNEEEGLRERPCHQPLPPSTQELIVSYRTRKLYSLHLLILYHLRWYSSANEYLSQKGAVNDVVRLLEIYEAYQERYSCLLPNFLQPANHKHHIRGPAIGSKPALLLQEQSLRLTVSAESLGNHFKENLTSV